MGFKSLIYIMVIFILCTSNDEIINRNLKQINDYSSYNKTKNILLKKFDEDTDIMINNDYFECVSQEKTFKLMANTENKPYLNLKTNYRFDVTLNNATIEDYEIQIIIKESEFHYLNVDGTKTYPVCIYIFYTEKDIIEVKKDIKYKFKVFYDFYYKFNLIDLIEEKGIAIRLESENKSTKFRTDFEGAEEYNIHSSKNPDKIQITPKNKTVKIKLNVYNYDDVDDFTFYFYDDRIRQFKILYITAIVFGSICFVAIACLLYFIYCQDNTFVSSSNLDYLKEKFISVYLCKKYDMLNNKTFLEHFGYEFNSRFSFDAFHSLYIRPKHN